LFGAAAEDFEQPPDDRKKPDNLSRMRPLGTSGLRQAITYIWGPPGCGKTYTLAEVVRTAFEAGRRILICSNTNRAVDQVLYRICETLTISHPAMQEGRIVRMGRIADDKLANEYSEYVTVEGIGARLSRELAARLQQLQDEIAQIDARSAAARRIIELFSRLETSEQRMRSLQESVNVAAREGKSLLARSGEIKRRIGDLTIEQSSRGKLFGLLKRRPEAIERDIRAAREQLAKIEGHAAPAKASYDVLRLQFDQSVKDRDSVASQCAGHDRAAAQAVVDKAEDDRSSLVVELREIEAKIADIQAAIVKNAKILGATTTKAYLAVREIGQFDIVIIDEGSMVLLPMVWFAAGMAKDQVIVSGDFRQIPPIVQTKSQAIFDILGYDVFSAAGLDDPAKADGRMVMLNTQRRMDDAVCRLISEPMYKGLLRTEPDPQLWANRKSRKRPPSPFDGALTIVDTSDLWPFESVTPFFSRFNLMHALLVRNLAWHFAELGYVRSDKDMGICTPYAAQAKLIRKLLEGESLGDVQVGTVHAFQGDERNLMVLEVPEGRGGGKMLGQFVQGIPPRSAGARLINVAVSRAENHILVLANLTHLDRLLPSTALLRGILFDMQERGRVVAGSEVLRLRPIERDLRGLLGRIKLDVEANEFGLFNQSTFDAAIEADIQAAKEGIVIFSGFVTPSRVAKLGDLLRLKVQSGVAVRCVTRPPNMNGTMDPELGKEALDALEGIGCVVDCRARIHEKIVVIDKKVVWHGSLNVLSHSHRTDESMTRVVNSAYAQGVAAAMSKRPVSAEKALKSLTEAENPRCPDCGARTYYNDGKFGPFFACEAGCGWHQNAKSNGKTVSGNGKSASKAAPKKGLPCPICGSDTKLVSGPYGEFYGCVRYPECNGKLKTKATPTKTKARRKKGSKRSA
jgi:ssDNA-binding Zn-finger/Zn-ribbon topoisomerase 1